MRSLNSDHMGLQRFLDGLLGLLAGIAIGFVLLTTCGCAVAKKAPELVPAPVIHVAPAPPVPQYGFKPGPGMTACLSFDGLVAQQQELAYLYARLEYFKALLLAYGAVFDPPPPAPAQAATP